MDTPYEAPRAEKEDTPVGSKKIGRKERGWASIAFFASAVLAGCTAPLVALGAQVNPSWMALVGIGGTVPVALASAVAGLKARSPDWDGRVERYRLVLGLLLLTNLFVAGTILGAVAVAVGLVGTQLHKRGVREEIADLSA